jgi:DNA-binding MarR family transcriptional regulator
MADSVRVKGTMTDKVRDDYLAVKNLDSKIVRAYAHGMGQETDVIDRMMTAWRRELPALDPSPLGLVGRVIVLAQHLERSVNAALARHHLTLGQFDILATLRRHGAKGGLTPKQLLASVMLTSGGMTARLQKLEDELLLRRLPDPNDRRGVVVELTAKGRKVIDAAAATRFAEARESLPPVDASERRVFEELLRQWLVAVAGR